MVLLVGYSCYTGNRLANTPDTLDDYKRCVFTAKDGTMVAFTDENVWYGKSGESLILLEIIAYKDGLISMEYETVAYEFFAIDGLTLYDVQTQSLLVRREDG
jgi:hypothetical protein